MGRIDLDELTRRVESLEEFSIRFLKEILSIPTVSPSGERYGDFAKRSRELLEEQGVDVEIIEVPQEYVDKVVPEEGRGNPRYIVRASIGDKNNIKLHLNGHYDVVPGGPGWRVTEPFKPVLKDGKIFGRGATDMKGGVASIATALAALAQYQDRLDFGVEAVFVPDEEIGGEAGTGYVVSNNLVRGRYVVIAEPSSLDQVYIGHKGLVWGIVRVKGKSAHASTHWLGVNAFENAVKLASEIFSKLAPSIESRRSSYRFDVPEGAKPTIMFGGLVRGGEKINQVPGEFSFSFDRRLVPEETVDKAWREIEEFIKEASRRLGIDVELSMVQKMEPVVVDPNAKIFNAIEESMLKITGRRPNRIVCIGGLDMRYYVYKGYETATIGPGILGTAHAPDEYILVSDMINAAKLYTILPFHL